MKIRSRESPRWQTLLLVALVTGFGPVPGNTHPAYLTAAQVTVAADGSFRTNLRFDTLAFALNDTSARIGNEPMDELLSGPKESLETKLAGAGERLKHGFHLLTDAGEGVVEEVDFPGADAVLVWRDTVRPALPVVIPAKLSGHLPRNARTVAVRFPAVLEQVILTVERPDEEPYAEPVEAGAASTSLPIKLATVGAGNTATRSVAPAKTTMEPDHGSKPVARWDRQPGQKLLRSLGLLALLSLLGVIGWRRTGKKTVP